jgi:hypothetical protein
MNHDRCVSLNCSESVKPICKRSKPKRRIPLAEMSHLLIRSPRPPLKCQNLRRRIGDIHIVLHSLPERPPQPRNHTTWSLSKRLAHLEERERSRQSENSSIHLIKQHPNCTPSSISFCNCAVRLTRTFCWLGTQVFNYGGTSFGKIRLLYANRKNIGNLGPPVIVPIVHVPFWRRKSCHLTSVIDAKSRNSTLRYAWVYPIFSSEKWNQL